MNQPRILVLSTYPIKNPLHGGQIRVSKIVDQYRSYGFTTKHIAVIPSETYNKCDKHPSDIEICLTKYSNLGNIYLSEDLALGKVLEQDEILFKKLRKIISKFSPHVIQLEHPWLYLPIAKLKNTDPNLDFRLVYSSHNNEAKLKATIIGKFDSPRAIHIKSEIASLEKGLCQVADLTFAVSENDLKMARAYGSHNVHLFPNASSSPTPDAKTIEKWRTDPRLKGKQTAFFCASAHPPNAYGFADLLGPQLGYLSPDSTVAVGGSIGNIIFGDLGLKSTDYRMLNESRVTKLGLLTKRDIAALLHLANVVILPITEGEGSNLKTAEALLSGRPIIATQKAFRGYESFIDEPQVTIANTEETFKLALTRILNYDSASPDQTASAMDRNKLIATSKYQQLTWDSALSNMPNIVCSLFPSTKNIYKSEQANSSLLAKSKPSPNMSS